MEEQKQDLEILYPDGIDVPVGDGFINVKEFKTKEFLKVMKFYKVLMPIVAQNTETSLNEDGSIKSQHVNFLSVLADGSEHLMNFMSIAINQSEDYIENLDLDVTVALLKAIFDVNKDIYEKKISPQLAKFM